MTVINDPIIKKYSKKPYTKNYMENRSKRFNLETFSENMTSLMVRRIYDIAGITENKLHVYFNDEKLKLNHFKTI